MHNLSGSLMQSIPKEPTLTIIIPTYNEKNNDCLPKLLKVCNELPISSTEVIVVDSNSDDGSLDLIKKYQQIKCIQINDTSRAARINYGVKTSKGKLILLHHPRCTLSKEGINHLINSFKTFKKDTWGGFTITFDHGHPLLKYVAWYSNQIRALKKRIVYLDHCIFFHADLKTQLFPIPDVDIFEDTILSKRLAKFSKPLLVDHFSIASAIRFKTRGVVKHFCLNQLLKILYHLGFDTKRLNTIYEKGCQLNVRT